MNPKTVLVVEDSSSFRVVVKLALERAGYRVAEATDGLDATAKLDKVRPDVIVCDINMPRQDGLSFARQLRENATHKFVPVIMLTTESDPRIKAEGKAAGVRAWITKPFPPERLVDAVNHFCAA